MQKRYIKNEKTISLPIYSQNDELVLYEVKVDSEKCTGCGECVDICPKEVFELQDEKSVPVKAEECVGC